MNEIITILEERLNLADEGAESFYELGYADAIKYVIYLLKNQQSAQVPDNR